MQRTCRPAHSVVLPPLASAPLQILYHPWPNRPLPSHLHPHRPCPLPSHLAPAPVVTLAVAFVVVSYAALLLCSHASASTSGAGEGVAHVCGMGSLHATHHHVRMEGRGAHAVARGCRGVGALHSHRARHGLPQNFTQIRAILIEISKWNLEGNRRVK